MRGLLLAAVLLLAGCTPAGQILFSLLPDGTIPLLLSNLERESDANRKRVSELERAGDWAGLAKLAEDHIEKQTSNASWWMVAGYAHSRLKDHARAIECFREMIRLEPDVPEAWNLLAQEHRMSGNPRRAVEVLTQALTALRDTPVTLMLLGESYSELGNYDLAARAYRQSLDLDAGLTPAWAGLARAHIKRGQWAEAESIARAQEKTNSPLAAAIRAEIKGAQ